MTWENGTGDVVGYLGGSAVCTKSSFQDNEGALSGGGKLYIGQLQTGYDSGFKDDDTFKGYMAGFYLWPSVLSASDIQQMSLSCHNVAARESAVVKWDQLVQNRTGGAVITTSTPCP